MTRHVRGWSAWRATPTPALVALTNPSSVAPRATRVPSPVRGGNMPLDPSDIGKPRRLYTAEARGSLVQMPPLRVTHLDTAVREVVLPSFRHAGGRVLPRRQLLGIPRLHAGIDDHRPLVGDVIP